MSYTQIDWQNKPSTATPINRTNLNHMDAGIAALDTAMADKVDKVAGKGLSTEDFTTEEKTKLAGIEDGAEVNVQSDWEQADNAADDYIKNKPDLSVYAERDELWADATQTGNPVTLKTQSAQNAKQTMLTMTPIQSGSGTPSPQNIRPISGRTQAVIDCLGKNLLEIANGFDKGITGTTIRVTTANNGEITLNGAMSTSSGIAIWNLAWLESTGNPQSDNKKHLFNGTYKASGLINNMRIQVYGSDDLDAGSSSASQIDAFYIGHETVTINTNYKYVWLRMSISANASFDNVTFRPMIYNTKYDDSTYEKFAKTSVTIPLGQTVSGGTLDVETGELSIEWAYIASYNGETITEPWISSIDEYVPNTTPSTGAEVAYKLATPTTATLTAAQVALIKGINNISTDADSLTITYFNDGESLTDADNRITGVLGDFAKVEGAKASQNYAVGDYLIFADKFCKASVAIATGEALAIGTNLTQTTIGAELKAIIAQL